MDNLFKNTERAAQLINFDTLRLGGSMMPTDVDGLIEYQDTCYVFIEYKYHDAPVSKGQGLALVRLCDDLQRVKNTVLIYASHDVADPKEQVSAGDAIVVKYRFKGMWHDGEQRPVKQIVRWFIENYGVHRKEQE